MAYALKILGTIAIDLLDATAIILFLLVGIVGAAVFERTTSRPVKPEAAHQSPDFAVLLERLVFSLRSYVGGLLNQDAGRFLPWLISIISVASGIVGFAALSFGPAVHLAALNTGIVFIFGASMLGIHGGVLARGFSQRSTPLAGVVRNGIRVASFELAAALALISGVVLAGSISVDGIVEAQLDQGAWFLFLAPLGFLIYFAASIAGIDSAARPKTQADGGEQSDSADAPRPFRWPFGSLGATIHLLIGAGLATTLFLGGWLRPFASYRDHFAGMPFELLDVLPPLTMAAAAAYCLRLASREADHGRKQLMNVACAICAVLFVILTAALFQPVALAAVHGAFWFLAKMGVYIYALLWTRARIPQFRFGRPIRAAWNFLIPIAAVNLACVAAALAARERWDWSPAASTFAATASALVIAVWLGLHDAEETAAYPVES
jgi:NADH-quinone oxidoreductase subunit H